MQVFLVKYAFPISQMFHEFGNLINQILQTHASVTFWKFHICESE